MDFDGSPIVLRQTRAAGAAGITIGVLALGFGLSIPPGHLLLDGLFPVEWFAVPAGALALAAGLISLVWPGRLILAPEGFVYRLLLRTQAAPWSAVAAVDLYLLRGEPRSISFRLVTGKRVTLAGGWPYDARSMQSLVQRARAQWTQGARTARA